MIFHERSLRGSPRRERQIVLIGLGLAGILLAICVILSVAGMRELTKNDRPLEPSIDRLSSLASVATRLSVIREIEDMSSAAAEPEPTLIERRIDAEAALTAALAELSKASQTDPDQQAHVAALERAIAAELRVQAATALPAHRDRSDRSMAHVERVERDHVRQRHENQRRLSQGAVATGLFAAIVACLTLWFFYGQIRNFQRARLLGARLARSGIVCHHDPHDGTGDATLTADSAGRITALNAMAERITGWSRAEALGRPLEEVVRIEGVSGRAGLDSSAGLRFTSTVPTDPTTDDRPVLRTKDDSTRVIEQTAATFRDERGTPHGVLVVLRDVTKAIENERALKERVALAEFVSEVIAHLVLDEPLAKILLRCAEAVQRRLDGAFTSIWIIRDATTGLELVANAGPYAHIDGPSRVLPIGENKVRKIAKTKEPVLVNHVIGDDRIVNQEWARREQLIAFAGYPLLIEGRLVGVLAMFARHELSAATLDAFSLVASALALTVERKLAEQELEQREARFRSLVIASTQIVWRADERGVIVDDVSSWRTVTGEEFHSFHGEGWFGFVHPDEFERVTESWRRGIESGTTFAFELRLRRSHGEYRRMAMRAVPIRDDEGVIHEWIGTHIDITDQREAEEHLRESEDRYRALVELSPQAVWLADASGNVTYANQWWLEYSGLTLERLSGPEGAAVIHPDHIERARELWSGRLRGERSWTLELPLRRARDGHYRWHYVRAQRIDDAETGATRWIAVAIDIDDRKQSERERERLAFLVENSRDFIGIYDDAGRSVYLNRAGMNLVGIADARELPSIRLAELIHEDERPLISEILLPRAEREGVANIELRFRHRVTGKHVWMDFGILVMRNTDGAIEGFATISREITEKKAAREELAASQRFLRSALDALASHIAVLDDRGMILAVNRSWNDFVTTSGLDSAQFDVGTNYLANFEATQNVAREHVAVALRAVRDVIRGECDTGVVEYRVSPSATPDSEIWYQLRVTRFVGSDAARVVVAHENVTQRKQSEIATKRRSEQLRRLAQLTTDLSLLHEVPAILDVVTEGTRSILGARRAITRIASDPAGDADDSGDNEVSNARSPRPVAEVERVLVDHVQGTNRPLRVTGAELAASHLFDVDAIEPLKHGRSWLAAPLNRLDGENDGVILLADKESGPFTSDDEAILVQIARMTTIAIDNARLYGDLVRADRRKDEFLATLAHELRNPLAPIRFWLEILSVDSSQEAMIEARKVIDGQIRHMVRLIDDLMDLSRISFDKLELRRERVAIAEVISSAIETSRPAIEGKGQFLSTTLPVERVFLFADPTRIAQIVSNLLNNASKYSSKEGQISLTVRIEGTTAVITVADEGIGIAAEALPRIFEPFVQDSRTRGRSEGGIGIGLSLVRRIAELHEGTVTARSAGPGRGSEFEVRLPIAEEPAATDLVVREPPLEMKGVKGSSRRILIVDDNVDSTTSLARLLAMLGHSCSTANDGGGAIARAAEFQPDVVLLDIGLPDVSGFEVARHLRRADGSRVPVLIAVTGWGQPEDRSRSRDAGFDFHLVKPVDFDELTILLDSCNRP